MDVLKAGGVYMSRTKGKGDKGFGGGGGGGGGYGGGYGGGGSRDRDYDSGYGSRDSRDRSYSRSGSIDSSSSRGRPGLLEDRGGGYDREREYDRGDRTQGFPHPRIGLLCVHLGGYFFCFPPFFFPCRFRVGKICCVSCALWNHSQKNSQSHGVEKL
eukprot:EG_transcript_24794